MSAIFLPLFPGVKAPENRKLAFFLYLSDIVPLLPFPPPVTAIAFLDL